MKDVLSSILYSFQHISVNDVIDILFVTLLVYLLIKLISGTRAAQLTKGLILVVVCLQLAKLFQLSATVYILSSCIEFGIMFIIVVFQPELRSALEKLGRTSSLKSIKILSGENEEKNKIMETMISEVIEAVSYFAKTKTGALIVIERETKLGDIVSKGIPFDAAPKAELIENLFFDKAPLHDGAMIIREGRIAAAGCYLPLHEGKMDTELGTRHRAGLGVSEVSDAVTIIVSEETGVISLSMNGTLQRRLTPEKLSEKLHGIYIKESESKKDFLSGILKGRESSK